MADYYTTEHLVVHLGVAESQIASLVSQHLLLPIMKNGRQFHPAREVYRLKAAIKLAGKRKISLEDAMTQVSARLLYQVENPPR
jgi:hypothetical protein